MEDVETGVLLLASLPKLARLAPYDQWSVAERVVQRDECEWVAFRCNWFTYQSDETLLTIIKKAKARPDLFTGQFPIRVDGLDIDTLDDAVSLMLRLVFKVPAKARPESWMIYGGRRLSDGSVNNLWPLALDPNGRFAPASLSGTNPFFADNGGNRYFSSAINDARFVMKSYPRRGEYTGMWDW